MDIYANAETGKVLRPIKILSIGTSGGAPGDDLENRVDRGSVPKPHVSGRQAGELVPDRANPASIELLRQLGDKQAQFVESEARTRSSLGGLVNDIFLKPRRQD
jgi:hypothetical protein